MRVLLFKLAARSEIGTDLDTAGVYEGSIATCPSSATCVQILDESIRGGRFQIHL